MKKTSDLQTSLFGDGPPPADATERSVQPDPQAKPVHVANPDTSEAARESTPDPPASTAPHTIESAPERSTPAPPSVPPPPASPPDDDDGGDGEGDGATIPLLRATRDRYLNYALSVITSRALPDVRDGLKPVQRRIVYAMFKNLRLTHQARFRKSAAVVGEVMARFHPHGDQSIYDAMVRMAQPFSLRTPLVEGHGNFGSLDGDPPAAMRYTEARLRAAAEELVSEIDKDTVPFRGNYDGTTQEPVVLPARLPQLLVNGSTGIAVGMATNIPPHNLREVCRAAVALIDSPHLTAAQLLDLELIEGPDFPVGGEILNSREELASLYDTGRGSVRLRGTWDLEKIGRRRAAVLKSVPYGVNKAQLIERIGDLIRLGKVPQLVDVRDESTEDIRVVLELKRGADPEVAMAYLYKHTPLEGNFNVNLTVLVPTENPEVCSPARLSLPELLRHFLVFRHGVVRRRFEYDLARLLKRIHILRGYAIVFDALDEAITIIRSSPGKRGAAERLMARFPLDDDQVEAILELKLYRLAALEIEKVREELERLEKEAAYIQGLLADDRALWGVVRTELLEVAEAHGDDRRTVITGPKPAVHFDPEAYILDEDHWVIVTRAGWIKRQKNFSSIDAVRVRDGDAPMTAFRASTRSTVSFFGDSGKCWVLRVADVPMTTGYGEPIQRQFALADGERIVAAVSQDPRHLPTHEPEWRIPVATPVVVDESTENQPDDPSAEDSPTPSSDAEDDAVKAEAGETTGETDPTDAEAPEPAYETISVGPVAVAITRMGKGLLFPLRNHSEVSTKSGRKYASLQKGGADRVLGVVPIQAAEARVCLASEQGRVIVFTAESLKLLRAAGRGVNALRLTARDALLGFTLANSKREGLEIETTNGRSVRVTERKYGLTRRGGKGLEVIKRGGLRLVDVDPVVLDLARPTDAEAVDLEDEDEDDVATLDHDASVTSETDDG